MEVILLSRNAQSRFSMNPTNIDIGRSTFNRSSSVKTSFNVGQIIPFYVDEVLPGDTFKIRTSKVVRLQTLLTPIMDNMYLDTYYFFVPNRLVWNHWQEFCGENNTTPWTQPVTYQIPQVTAPSGGWDVGTIADYMGIPVNVAGLSVNALPFRAYALICNDWFRDQNLSTPLNVPVDETTLTGVNTANFVTDICKGGKPYTAAKYHDYFTSALPAPQKGPDVMVPLGSIAPIYGDGNALALTRMNSAGSLHYLGAYVNDSLGYIQGNPMTLGVSDLGQTNVSLPGFVDAETDQSSFDGELELYGIAQPNQIAASDAVNASSGLYADLTAASGASINSLRLAFQIQRLYEKDARGGTRYIELLKSHFGVTSPDARLQRPEYLGGNRIPININQVVQSSGTGSSVDTPQGNVAAYSVTSDAHFDFSKSFVEHGYVIGLAVVRYDHTYQQGLAKMWSRKDRFDFYWPVLANIGEQPIYNREIYAQGTAKDDEVFGYQEAWGDYRYKPSIVTGEMRSSYSASLDVWHLGDFYQSQPYLSDTWIREDSSIVDRVLAVSSSVSNQLFGDFYVENQTTRPMPLYSIPGLIDHH